MVMTFGNAWKDMVNMSAGDPMMQSVVNVLNTYFRVMVPVMVIVMLMIGVGIELLIYALGQRRYWAWVMGIVFCGLLIVVGHNIVTIILGGLAFWGLLDKETLGAFLQRSSADRQMIDS
jgi:hypothetical protein